MQDNIQNPDGISFIWNTTPNSKVQQARSVIHPAFHYTPLSNPNAPRMQYIPLTCSCEAVLNKYCPIDFNMKSIKCCFCGTVTALPASYAKAISPNKLPYEFMPQNSTFEFSVEHKPASNPNPKNNTALPASSARCLLFVVDLCVSDKQIEAVKGSIIDVLNNTPADGTVFIGLITFFKHINVYELSSKINTVFCINGTKDYNMVDIMNILGVSVKTEPQGKSYEILRRFIVQVNNKQDMQRIVRRVRDIKKDQTITVAERTPRATGQAINVALSLAEVSIMAPRIVFMVGGPCTVGPGTVIGLSLKEMMRSARELLNGENIKYFAEAKKYYDSFQKRVINKKIIMDLFAFTLEEPGLAEMSQLFMGSGGLIVMHEEFSDRIFKQSFRKVFFPASEEAPHIEICTEGIVSVYTSKDLVINGAFGHCYSLNRAKPFVSQKVIGKGRTNSWYFGSLDPGRTITIMYETKEAETKEQNFYVQLKTTYRQPNGTHVTRVTTVERRWSALVHEIASGFDQEAAIVYLARYCVHKALIEEQKNLRQWLDSCLCKWASYFADYRKNDMNSFTLPETMRTFPQFMYHLRRSSFVNRFGSSLDESFYRAYTLNRENITNCTTMIQPILLKYTLENLEPEPVPLDEQQMKQDVILLLDSYFNVIQWYGETVNQWLNERYHETEGYEHIKQFFEAPKQDIDYIMSTRFPVPNYYLTHPAHSKERYLKSRVNPRKAYGQENENTLTDDSDLKTFSEHLVKVVTTQNLS